MKPRTRSTIHVAAASLCVLLISLPSGLAQNPIPPPAVAPPLQQQPELQPAATLLAPDQLDNLVAPVALYPDPLLGQVLAASTYPLEIVEALQWFQQNGNLAGAQLMDAARQQNWDPSVQAMVAFPDVLRLLGNDVRWTTDLGNAFLAQQADLMAAVQRMRGRAQANGRLQSTPQQMVTTGTQDGQSAIEIQPASPQVMYVPVYQPEYVWGPPAYGAYPATWYPQGFGYGYGFDAGIFLSSLFQGFTGWGGWGWVLNWLGHGLLGNGLFGHGGYGGYGNGLLVNAGFFNHYGFRSGFAGAGGGAFRGGLGAWQHNPGHRMGVQYPNQAVASRFNRSYGGQFNGGRSAGNYGNQGNLRGYGGGANRPAANSFAGSYGQASRSYQAPSRSYQTPARSYQAPAEGFRGFYSAPGRGSGSSYAAQGRGSGSSYAAQGRGSGSSYAAQGRGSASSYAAPGRGGASSYAGSSTSRIQNYSAPRGYSAPRQSYSAPRSVQAPRSFQAPHSAGKAPHVSGGHSGGGGGHSRGGGGGHSHGGGGHHK